MARSVWLVWRGTILLRERRAAEASGGPVAAWVCDHPAMVAPPGIRSVLALTTVALLLAGCPDDPAEDGSGDSGATMSPGSSGGMQTDSTSAGPTSAPSAPAC